MNIDTNRNEEETFCIEDVVSYSNIEISHVNDNRTPIKTLIAKNAIWLIILALITALIFI